MKKVNVLSIILLSTVLMCTKCAKKTSDNGFSFDESALKQKFTKLKTANLALANAENKAVDSVVFYISEQKVASTQKTLTASVDLKNQKLGSQVVKANIFFDGQPQPQQVFAKLEIVSAIVPKLLNFEVVNTFVHDTTSFTEGLEFYKGVLYENTGLTGKSRLLKTDFRTGKILQAVPMDANYFGEGITIVNDKIYQLTWQNKVGLIYDAATMTFQKKFDYDKPIEGWGMTNDGKNIYQSDGTEKIWTMNPGTQKMVSFVNVYSGTEKIKSVNELEWIEGKIYANIWQKDAIAIVDPLTGDVEQILNLAGLRKKLGNKKAEVLNGIAYNPASKTIFVTGKNWDKMFEIKVLGVK